MSRRRTRKSSESPIRRRFAGGCPDCDAYSDLIEEAPHVFVLAVRHDSTCPNFAQMRAGRSL